MDVVNKVFIFSSIFFGFGYIGGYIGKSLNGPGNSDYIPSNSELIKLDH
jgi:hypothetical protein